MNIEYSMQIRDQAQVLLKYFFAQKHQVFRVRVWADKNAKPTFALPMRIANKKKTVCLCTMQSVHDST